MAAYESYKDSGVKWLGKIPSHWEVKKLRAFFSEVCESNFALKVHNQLQFKYGTIVPKPDTGVDDAVLKTISKYTVVNRGDIIINGLNLNYDFISFRVGKVNEQGVITSAYIAMRPNKGLSSKFYEYLLKAMDAKKVFHGFGTGIRATLSFKELKHKFLPLVPLNEQEAIVAYLDKVTGDIDRAIEAQQKMIDALSERKQIIITRAVIRGLNPGVSLRDSGIDWLGQIPKHWKVSQLRRIAAVKTGKTPPSSTPEYYENRDIIWYTPGDFPISSIYLGDSERKLDNRASKLITIYPANTVLLVGIGGTLGKVGFTEKSCFSNQQINAIIPALSFNGKFLAYYLTAIKDAIRNSANSATLPILNQNATKRLPIVVAPLNEQNCIVEAIEKGIAPLTDSIKHCERMISLLQERKQIIINEVVTGKKKVI